MNRLRHDPARCARRTHDRRGAGTCRAARQGTPSLSRLRPPVPDSRRCAGVCKVRFNEHGRLRVPFGYVGGVQCDPVEKKPFFHAYPGRARVQFRHARLRPALQLLSELGDVAGAARSAGRALPTRRRRPTRSSTDAVSLGAQVIVSTYNEPLITAEWAVEMFKEARAARAGRPGSSPTATARRACSSTSGRISISTRSISRASTIAATVSWADACNRSSTRSPGCHDAGVWVEIVTLLIPGFNDSEDELRGLTRFLAGVSRGHPVARHGVSPRLPDDRGRRDTRRRCCSARLAIGHEAGLRYVYAGNLPGRVGEPGTYILPRLRRSARSRATDT